MSRWALFSLVILPVTTVAAGVSATVMWLKGRRVYASIGFTAAASGVALTVWSWFASTESFADLGVAVLYLFWLLPLTAVSLIGALLPARAGSRWFGAR